MMVAVNQTTTTGGAAAAASEGAPSTEGGTRAYDIHAKLNDPEAKKVGLGNPIDFVSAAKDFPPDLKSDADDQHIIDALKGAGVLTEPQVAFIESHFHGADKDAVYHQIADAARLRMITNKFKEGDKLSDADKQVVANVLGNSFAPGMAGKPMPYPSDFASLDPSQQAVVKIFAGKFGLDPEELASSAMHSAQVQNGNGTDPAVTGQPPAEAKPAPEGAKPEGDSHGHLHVEITKKDGTKVVADYDFNGRMPGLPFLPPFLAHHFRHHHHSAQPAASPQGNGTPGAPGSPGSPSSPGSPGTSETSPS